MNEQAYQANLTVLPSQVVDIKGEIEVDSQHLGQLADLLMGIGITRFDTTDQLEQFFMVDSQQQLQPLEEPLIARQTGVTLA